jgi:hypothetical protein
VLERYQEGPETIYTPIHTPIQPHKRISQGRATTNPARLYLDDVESPTGSA